jgi:hypothetical protein
VAACLSPRCNCPQHASRPVPLPQGHGWPNTPLFRDDMRVNDEFVNIQLREPHYLYGIVEVLLRA